MLPPIDAHAHIDVRIAPSELHALGAVVFAVTRSLDEWEAAQRRRDQMTLWGVGCHPAVPAAATSFSEARFARALATAAFVGEVGLDRRSRVPMQRQVTVLSEILRAVQTTPRPVSLHSTGATSAVLDALEQHPVAMPILHWWRGSHAETLRALELGCVFSLNGHEAQSPKVIDVIPPDRVLTRRTSRIHVATIAPQIDPEPSRHLRASSAPIMGSVEPNCASACG
jgi:TatD DNase family protein